MGSFKETIKNIFLKKIKSTNLETHEKWLEEVLRNLPSGSRILDAGAGETQYKRFCTHLTYVSQDFSQYDGKGDETGLQEMSWDVSKIDIVSDIRAIPEPNQSFDAIMCIEVFEHLSAPIEALKEFNRLLRPAGYLILTAPFASLTHFAPFHFYSGFNRYFYQKWLNEFGFNIIEIVPNGNYFEFLIQEMLRINFMSKKYTSKAKRLSLCEFYAIWKVMKTLKRLSKNDSESYNALCFGYNVLSQKR